MLNKRDTLLFALGATLLHHLPIASAQTATRGSTASAATPSAGGGAAKLADADRRFLLDAAHGGMAEVAGGELAQQRGSADAVKQFGARMAQDHGQANMALKQLAAAKGVELPEAAPDMPSDSKLKHLKTLSGSAFDREYMRDMVDDHTKDVAKFQKASTSAQDPDVRAFAAKTLPTLQEHLKLAKATARAK